MKFTLPALVLVSLSGVSAFGSLSGSFTRQMPVTSSKRRMTGTMLMYEVSKDPPSSGGDKGTNLWSILAETENWLSNVLGNAKASNPFKRKEVSYLCDMSDHDALVVAGFWRRLREAREQGQSHGKIQERKLVGKPSDYIPPTLRQTQVLVLPNDSNLDKFQTFDTLITMINQCRRNARDYVLDVNLDKGEEKTKIGERDWSVSINLAHLHPKYGQKTRQQQLEEMRKEEQEGELDVNLKLYKEKRLLARRSPYPTVCIEVRSTPPPDFSQAGPSQGAVRESNATKEGGEVTSDDVKRLEMLFGQTASFAKESKKNDDTFYNTIAEVDGIEELSLKSPLETTQEWIAEHHNSFDVTTSTFTTTKCQQIDEGYEFIFSNIAMKLSTETDPTDTAQYLLFERFMSSSATSFEKFSKELISLISLLPSIKGNIKVGTLHPEHIESTKRSPMPVLVLTWK